MFAEISQRMFSEIMSAFTEVAKMETKNSERRALFSSKCFRGALSIVDNWIENWKNIKKKLFPLMRRRKLKWNFMLPQYWILLTGQFTNLEGIHSAVDVASHGFNDRVSLVFFLHQQPGEKNHFASKLNLGEITTERHRDTNLKCCRVLDFLGRKETVEIEI